MLYSSHVQCRYELSRCNLLVFLFFFFPMTIMLVEASMSIEVFDDKKRITEKSCRAR